MGPTPEGRFATEIVERLREIGACTRRFGETIYGTGGGPMPPQSFGVMTRKEDRLVLHLLDPEASERVVLPEPPISMSMKRRSSDPLSPSGSGSPPDAELEIPSDGRHPTDTVVVLRLRV